MLREMMNESWGLIDWLFLLFLGIVNVLTATGVTYIVSYAIAPKGLDRREYAHNRAGHDSIAGTAAGGCATGGVLWFVFGMAGVFSDETTWQYLMHLSLTSAGCTAVFALYCAFKRSVNKPEP